MPAPNLSDTLTEGPRLAFELAAAFNPLVHWPLVAFTAKGREIPVLVMPGFGANDTTTSPLRHFLDAKGYVPYGWEYGRNRGPSEGTITHVTTRLHEIYARHDQPVALIGHSMGGLYARGLARSYPDMVDRVITLGTPFGISINPDAPVRVVQHLVQAFNRDADVSRDGVLMKNMMVPPDVPTTSIYTRHDGVVHWTSCINPEAPLAENIEVGMGASHCGLVAHPISIAVIADRLAADREDWKPFSVVDAPMLWPYISADQAHHGATPAMPKFSAAEQARIAAAKKHLGLRAA